MIKVSIGYIYMCVCVYNVNSNKIKKLKVD